MENTYGEKILEKCLDTDKEVNERMAKAKLGMKSITRITSSSLSMRNRLKRYEIYVKPILLNTSQT